MKKILVCFITVFCFMSFAGQKVSAANTYTQKEIIDGVGTYEPGATIQFENEVEVVITDLDGKNIFNQKGETVVLPEYSPKISSFKGWVFTSATTSNNQVNKIMFQPFFKTDIQVKKVTEGEPIILTVPKDQIPFGDGTYTTEWIVGGMGGGYAIEGAPKNSLTWTIPTGSENYKNGMKIALRVTHEKGKKVFSEEATLVIQAKVPAKETPTKKPSQNKDIVQTADVLPLFVTTLLAMGSIVMIIVSKKKKESYK